MNKSVIIGISIFFGLSSTFAQTPPLKWAANQGGTSSDYGKSIALDVNSNVFTTGSFSGTADMDPSSSIFNLTAAGASDIYVSKIDANGSFLWAFGIGGTQADEGTAIKIDFNGDVIITGSFQGAVDFDPSSNSTILTSFGMTDVFVAKYTNTGSLIWAKQMGGISEDIAFGLDVDASGNVYTTGHFYATADFDPGTGVHNYTSLGDMDIFISKLDINGDFSWAKRVGGTSEETGAALTLDNQGNVVVTGYFWLTVDFDPGAGTNNLTAGNSDAYILKLDLNGNFVSANNIGGTGNEYGLAILSDNASNIYIAGQFENVSDFEFGSGVTNLTSNGQSDAFVAKYNANNVLQWVYGVGGTLKDAARGLALTSTGDIVVTGYFRDAVDFDAGPGTTTLTSNGNIDAFVLQVSNNGIFDWAHHFGATNSDYGNDVVINSMNDIFLIGEFYDIVDFNPGAITTNLSSNGVGDAFIVKLGCSSAGIATITACDSLQWIDGNTYLSNNTSATHVLTNYLGCDSLVTLNLTINHTPDNSVTLNGNSLTATASGVTYQWIDCANGNALISGEVGQSFTATITGSYAVEVSANGCVDTSVCTAITIVGLIENDFEQEILLYPTPSTGKFTVELGDTHNQIDYFVVDEQGKQIVKGSVQHQKMFQVDLEVTKGIYFIHLQTKDKKAILKTLVY